MTGTFLRLVGRIETGGRGRPRAAVAVAAVTTLLFSTIVPVVSADSIGTTGDSMPYGPHEASAVWAGSRFLILGGLSTGGSTLTDNILSYVPGTNPVVEGHLPDALAAGAAIWDSRAIPGIGCPSGCAYVLGGTYQNFTTSDVIVKYNGTASTAYGRLPYATSYAAAVMHGSHIYLIGGQNQSSIHSEIWRYDPVLNQVERQNTGLNPPRMGHGAVTDGRFIYVIGGESGGAALTSIMKYDPLSDQEEPYDVNLPLTRVHFAVAWDGFSAWVLGGHEPGQNPAADIMRFQPTSGATVIAKTLPVGAGWAHTAAAFDGTGIYTFGGVGQGDTWHQKAITRYVPDPPPPPFPPGMPQNAAAIPGPWLGEIKVQWDPPANDGGSTVQGYKVYTSGGPGGPFDEGRPTPSSPFQDSGLPEGASRCYKVAAVNSVGEGPPSIVACATTWSAMSVLFRLVSEDHHSGEAADPDWSGDSHRLHGAEVWAVNCGSLAEVLRAGSDAEDGNADGEVVLRVPMGAESCLRFDVAGRIPIVLRNTFEPGKHESEFIPLPALGAASRAAEVSWTLESGWSALVEGGLPVQGVEYRHGKRVATDGGDWEIDAIRVSAARANGLSIVSAQQPLTSDLCSSSWTSGQRLSAILGARTDRQIGINAGFFTDRPLGLVVTGGQVIYNCGKANWPALVVGSDQVPRIVSHDVARQAIDKQPREASQVVQGSTLLLSAGLVAPALTGKAPTTFPESETGDLWLETTRFERSLVGVDGSGYLYFVTVQNTRDPPEHHRGATLLEAAEILRALGATDAMNLDGGGSSGLLLRGGIDTTVARGTREPCYNYLNDPTGQSDKMFGQHFNFPNCSFEQYLPAERPISNALVLFD